MSVWTADFETTSTANYEVEGRVRVWSSQIRELDSKEVLLNTNNLDDFMEYILNQSQSKKIFFHNLKFDGDFIVKWLLANGYKHLSFDDKPRPKTFRTLITEFGVWFRIEIYLKVFNKRYVKIEILDSFKKLPMSLRTIAKTFKLETVKGEIDYTKFREEDYQSTEDEQIYQDSDTLIMALALQHQFNEGLDKMTIASDAMSSYKNIIGKKRFEYLFPQIKLEYDNDIRRAYRGGWTYLKPEFASKIIKGLSTYDVNSLYPYVMHEKLLPYGLPVYFEGKYKQVKNYPLYIQSMNVRFKLKEGHLPTIQIKGNLRFIPTEYLEESGEEPVYLLMTNIDYHLMREHYDILEVEYLGGFMFKGARGLFKEYIDYWSHIKETSEGGLRTLAKLMLNSLYGKFAMNPKKVVKIPELKGDDVVYSRYELPDGDSIYTAMSAFITSYARELTIRSAQDNYDNFVYADTDSLHLLNDEGLKIPIDSKALGFWKFEGRADFAKFIRAKTYIKLNLRDKSGNYLKKENGLPHRREVICAGMTDSIKKNVRFKTFERGSIFEGKLQSKKVKGGTLLKETTFKIS